MMMGPFFAQLFKTQRGLASQESMVNHNLFITAAHIYSQDKECLDVFANEDFLWFLQYYCHSSVRRDHEAVCSALVFLF